MEISADAVTFVAVLGVRDRKVWLAPAQVGLEVAVGALDGVAVVRFLAGEAGDNVSILVTLVSDGGAQQAKVLVPGKLYLSG